MLTLELVDISKKYNSNSWTLSNVSATFKPGISVLLGPNGAGKTTLLRLIAGILSPGSGRVLFKGQDIKQDYSQYKQSIGYLPQEFGFYPNMTGRELLRYMAKLKGIPSSLYPARVEEVSHVIGITPFLDRKIDEWTVGLRRRLGITQALLTDPDILILDEPMVGLDQEEKLFLSNYFAQLGRERIIIYSSNILTDFISFTNSVLILVDGVLHFNGHVQDLIDHMDGKVWTAEVPAVLGPMITSTWAVSEMTIVGDTCRVRIASDSMPDIPGVCLTQPAVKDAYVYIVSGRIL